MKQLHKRSLLALSFFFLSLSGFSQLSPCFLKGMGSPYPSVGQFAKSMVIGDFNADGHPDFVYGANSIPSSMIVNLSNTTGSFVSTTYTNPGASLSIDKGDFNNDGKLDIVIPVTSGSVQVLLNNGSGIFLSPVSHTVSGPPKELEAADVNGDGSLDLMIGYYNNTVQVLLGNGAGSFTASTSFTTPSGGYTRYITSADFNNDAHTDLLIANGIGNDISIFLGNGSGTFSAYNTYTVGANPVAASIADFNNDTHSDLAIANFGSSDLLVMYGSATGTFSAGQTYAGTSGLNTVTSADYNNDGITDLAIARNTSINSLGILYGTSSGTFLPVNSFNYNTLCYTILSLDFNGDSKSDLITLQNNSTSNILLNQSFTFDAASSNSVICSGSSVTLTTNGTASSYSWSTGATTSSVIINPLISDTYIAYGINSTGCTIQKEVSITALPLPALSISQKKPGYFCVYKTDTLVASGANTYTWSTGTIGSTTSILVTNTVTTNYSVSGTANNGCKNTITYAINAKTGPTLTIQNSGSSSHTVCEGDAVNLTVLGYYGYLWDIAPAYSSLTFTASASASYSVYGKETFYGCTDTATYDLVVTKCTGFKELLSETTTVNIFPNPSHSVVFIECKDQNIYRLTLRNNLGSVLVEKQVNDPGLDTVRLDLSELLDGVYFIEVYQKNKLIATKKIFKD